MAYRHVARTLRMYAARALLLLLMSCCAQVMSAQFTLDGKRPFYDNVERIFLLPVPEDYYGKPYTARFVRDDSVTQVVKDGRQIHDTMPFKVVKGDTTYTFAYRCNGVIKFGGVRFTFLPVMKLSGNITDEYIVGKAYMEVPEDTIIREWNAKLKLAGASTTASWFRKHNFHVKFLDDTLEKMDVSFNGLRNDNHWRLDGGVIDFCRVRNKVSNGLWADMGTKPYYKEVQPNARSYTRGFIVELFVNEKYMGFCDMAECLDRKQMKLKKYDDAESEFHGMLWKAKEETWQTLFAADTIYDNEQEHWAGFDLEYPDLEDVSPTDYHILSDAIAFVENSDDAEFREHVGEYFDLPVLRDYYVFINVLLAVDNVCKNIIWGCFDGAVDKKLSLAVWDMDAVMGQYWTNEGEYYHGTKVAPDRDLKDVSLLSQNRLFMRLMEWPEFRQQVVDRYWELRKDILTPDSLISRFTDLYDVLRHSGALFRETKRFSGCSELGGYPLNFDVELDYVSDWLRRRIAYLDANTFVNSSRGDVDGNGVVSIDDLTVLIDYLLTGNIELINVGNSDIDLNGQVNIEDLTELIDMLLRMK